MSTRDGDPDGSSPIKPVSSLRSHFEQMNTSNKPVLTPTGQQKSDPKAQHAELEKRLGPVESRSSLDMPRRPSPWEIGNEVSSQRRGEKLSAPGTPKAQDGPLLPRQRPISMIASPPGSPRTKPKLRSQSPPKSIRLPPLNSASPRYPKSTPHTPTIRSGKPSPTIIPPITNKSPDPEVSTNASTAAPPQLNLPPQIQDCGVQKPSPIPPLVNRTEKPKLPSHPPMKSNAAAKPPPLESKKIESLRRASPVGTPLVKDPGSIQNGAESSAPNNGDPSKVMPANVQQGYFPPPPKHHTVIAQQQNPNNGPAALQRRDTGLLVKNTNPPPSRSVEPRPGLPPRPETNSGSKVRHQELVPPTVPRPRSKSPHKIVSQSAQSTSTNSAVSQPKVKQLEPSMQTALKKRPSGPSQPSHTDVPSRQSIDTTRVPEDANGSSRMNSSSEFPDATNSNRRPPRARKCATTIETKYDTRLFEVCGRFVCTTGYLTRAWDTTTGELVLSLTNGDKDIKVTSMAFMPGGTVDDEGRRLWLGTNYGEIQEIDILEQKIMHVKPAAHSRREIVKIYRYMSSMWSLDDDGKLHVWPPDGGGVPNLSNTPIAHRVPKGHTFSIVVSGLLWHAVGRDIRVFNPSAADDAFQFLTQPLSQVSAGEITSGATISNQLDRVYFGHSDGKISVYSGSNFSCLGVYNVSVYKINSLAGVGSYLWAGFNTGMIYVYDPQNRDNWLIVKDWQAHDHPVSGILTDDTSIWKLERLQVVSLGMDNNIRIWDGTLEDDWLESEMQKNDDRYCTFREITTVVVTWNAGASTPSSIRTDEKNSNFFREVIEVNDPPDILVFGFQELVDLDDKRLTAKSLFMGNKKKDSSEQDHMSRQYRAWRDYLVRVIEDNMPPDSPYDLLHTASMVGLFTCVFVKGTSRTQVQNLNAAEVKRGIGGLHGNKGALILRFLLDDTSLCFTNCHLAAGQSQTVNRNNDIAAILEATAFPAEKDLLTRVTTFIGGGDGSMIMDHEICILNGDLNYRIDTMGRDTVIKAIQAKNLSKLLERDQLLVSKRRNPAFRLRAFTESPITFAPTYKYDVGTDRYDSSEKNRSPAWCDRLLYRGVGRIKQLNYRRHELKVSDHRPVSGNFKMRIKSIVPEKREKVWEECETSFLEVRKGIARDTQIHYLVNILGTNVQEAKRLVAAG
ncbi:hypothetical protein MMC25_004181 [Agyrium rufum]|nr:hypothetical protein [Agyrium rufum]